MSSDSISRGNAERWGACPSRTVWTAWIHAHASRNWNHHWLKCHRMYLTHTRTFAEKRSSSRLFQVLLFICSNCIPPAMSDTASNFKPMLWTSPSRPPRNQWILQVSWMCKFPGSDSQQSITSAASQHTDLQSRKQKQPSSRLKVLPEVQHFVNALWAARTKYRDTEKLGVRRAAKGECNWWCLGTWFIGCY